MPKASANTNPTERQYQILVRPLVTEKTTKVAESGNWLAFEVAPGSTKPEIKAAVERLYGVEIIKVNTMITKGKIRGGRIGARSDVKKAFIQLKSGQSIDLMAGVK